jgi:hypothetical protein
MAVYVSTRCMAVPCLRGSHHPDWVRVLRCRSFQEYCNNELLVDAELPKAKKKKTDEPEEEGAPDAAGARKISQKTARAWLHKLGYDSRHKAMIGDVDHDIEVVQHMPDVQDVHDEQDGQIVQSAQELDGQLQ